MTTTDLTVPVESPRAVPVRTPLARGAATILAAWLLGDVLVWFID